MPHLSVADNVRFPLRMRGLGSREEQEAKVRTALETVQLAHLFQRRPVQLSGGQQQRVALARAIVSNPKVLLLDEPLSNLDARLREDMQVELIEIHKRLGLTTIFVTHDQEEALSLSNRIILLNGGYIEQQGTPAEIYARPDSAFASSFLGAANLVPAIIEAGDKPVAVLADGQRLAIAPDITTYGSTTIALRQEDLLISDAGRPGLQARVRTRVFLGSRNRYVLQLAGMDIKVLASTDRVYADGAMVTLSVDPVRVRCLPR